MANLIQNADGSVGVMNEQEGKEILRVGGPKTPLVASGFTHRAENVAKVTLGVATAGLSASLVSWQPPNNAEDVYVTRVEVVIGTTAQANLNCGVSSSSTGVGSNILDTLALSAPGLFDNITDKGSNGKSRQYVTAGSFVVASPSATPVGLVGSMYIHYVKV